MCFFLVEENRKRGANMQEKMNGSGSGHADFPSVVPKRKSASMTPKDGKLSKDSPDGKVGKK